jgi:hypothetical protein
MKTLAAKYKQAKNAYTEAQNAVVLKLTNVTATYVQVFRRLLALLGKKHILIIKDVTIEMMKCLMWVYFRCVVRPLSTYR